MEVEVEVASMAQARTDCSMEEVAAGTPARSKEAAAEGTGYRRSVLEEPELQ